MRKTLHSLTVAAAVAMLVPALAPAHELAVPGKTPASAVAVVSINDTQGLWQEFSQSPLNAPIEKLLTSPGFSSSPDFAEFQAEKAKAEAALGYPITGASLLGQVLKGLDFYVLSPAPGEEAGSDMNIVVAINFAQADLATKTVDHILATAAEDSSETVSEMDISGTKVRAIPGQQLYFATDGNIVLTASTERGIREIVEAKGAAPLLTSPDYAQGMSGLKDTPAQFWAYGDGSGIASLLEMAPGGGDMAAGAAALKGQTIAVAGKVASDHIRITQFVPASKFSESDKVVASTTVGPVDGSAKFMPDGGLLYYLNGKLDWAKLLDAAAADAAKLGPEAASQNPLQRENLNAMAAGMGLSFDEEILPVLGPDLGLGIGSIAFNPMGGSVPFTADIVISLKVNDAAKASALMSKFEGMITDQMKQQFENSGVAAPADLKLFEERDAAGTKIRAFSPPAGMEAQVPVMPAYAITQDNYLVLGASEQGLKDALARANGGANFQKGATTGRVAARSAAGNTNAFYLDLPKLVDIASGPVMMFAGGSMEEGERTMLVTGFELLRAMGLAYVGTSTDSGGKKTDIMLLMK